MKYNPPPPISDSTVYLRRIPAYTILSDAPKPFDNRSERRKPDPEDRANTALSLRFNPVQIPREIFSETNKEAQLQLLDMSHSVAAAKAALYISDQSYRSIKPPATVGKPPFESISDMSGTARHRRNTQASDQDKDLGPDLLLQVKRAGFDDHAQLPVSQGGLVRYVRLERHSSEDLRREHKANWSKSRSAPGILSFLHTVRNG